MGHFFLDRQYYINYYMSKKQGLILYSKLLHKMGHYFLDTQYIELTVIWAWPEFCWVEGRDAAFLPARKNLLNIYFLDFLLSVDA